MGSEILHGDATGGQSSSLFFLEGTLSLGVSVLIVGGWSSAGLFWEVNA